MVKVFFLLHLFVSFDALNQACNQALTYEVRRVEFRMTKTPRVQIALITIDVNFESFDPRLCVWLPKEAGADKNADEEAK